MTRSRTSLGDGQPSSGNSSDESSDAKSPEEEKTPSRGRKTEPVDEEMTDA